MASPSESLPSGAASTHSNERNEVMPRLTFSEAVRQSTADLLPLVEASLTELEAVAKRSQERLRTGLGRGRDRFNDLAREPMAIVRPLVHGALTPVFGRLHQAANILLNKDESLRTQVEARLRDVELRLTQIIETDAEQLIPKVQKAYAEIGVIADKWQPRLEAAEKDAQAHLEPAVMAFLNDLQTAVEQSLREITAAVDQSVAEIATTVDQTTNESTTERTARVASERAAAGAVAGEAKTRYLQGKSWVDGQLTFIKAQAGERLNDNPADYSPPDDVDSRERERWVLRAAVDASVFEMTPAVRDSLNDLDAVLESAAVRLGAVLQRTENRFRSVVDNPVAIARSLIYKAVLNLVPQAEGVLPALFPNDARLMESLNPVLQASRDRLRQPLRDYSARIKGVAKTHEPLLEKRAQEAEAMIKPVAQQAAAELTPVAQRAVAEIEPVVRSFTEDIETIADDAARFLAGLSGDSLESLVQ